MAICVVAAELGLQKQFSSLLPKNLVRNPELSDCLPAAARGREITTNNEKSESQKAWNSLGPLLSHCAASCVSF